jgi:Carboxypeptidase regulatory-like domain
MFAELNRSLVSSSLREQRTITLAVALIVLFGFTASTPFAHAQITQGEIDGVVKDSAGAVVPHASVVLTNVDQGLRVRTVQTDAGGQFTAPLIPVGTYLVTVDVQGFKTFHVTGLSVHVGAPTVVPVTLQVGSISEQVEVSASSLSVRLDTAAAGTIIDQHETTELPLSSRNFLQLMQIQPGVSTNVPGPDSRGNITTTGAVNTQTFSVNGSPASANGYFLDGADILKRAGQQPVTFASIDFIQEINLQRANYGSEFGGPGAAFVSVQTKSGTARLHGGAYEFYEDKVFNANNYFNNLSGVARPGARQNDYGYFIGGPVYIPKLFSLRSPKTFFSFGQEFLRQEASQSQTISNIPTVAQRSGTFSVPVCTSYSASNVCLTQATQINTIDPTAQEYLKDIVNKLPAPNNPADPQGLITNATGYNNETQTIIRIDRQLTSKLSVFFRYLDDPFHLVVANGFQATSLIPGVATSTMTNGSTNWLGHFTWVLGSSHVVEGGYSTRSNWVTAHAIGYMNKQNSPDIQVQLPYVNMTQQVPQMTINGSSYRVTEPYNERNPVTQIFLNNTNSLGRHTIKAGINIELQLGGSNNGISNQGLFAFAPGTLVAGSTQFAQSFANFLLGKAATFTQSNIDPVGTNKTSIYEGYVQDEYHLSSRISLSLGVRYSYFGTPIGAKLDGSYYTPVLNFDQSAFSPAAAPALTSTGLICTVGPCANGQAPNPNYNSLNGILQGGINSPFGDGGAAVKTDNFAPRFGFTLDVFGDGRTALRGGYGIFYYELVGNQSKIPTIQDPPNSVTATLSNVSFGNPGNGIPSFSSGPQGLQAFDATSRLPYGEQFSLDLQQQLRPGLVFDIGFYGNHAVHVPAAVDINQPQAGAFVTKGIIPCTPQPTCVSTVTSGNTQTLNLIRPFPGYSFITDQLNIFMAKYDSLQTSLEENLKNGTHITLNYTWAKALTNANTPQDNTNIRQDYGQTPLSRRHIFNASVVYPLPFFRAQKAILGHILGGFDLDAIVGYASGQFLTATQGGVDPGGLGLLTGPGGARPDYISNPNNKAPHTLTQWFNTAAFAAVPAGQYRAGTETYSNILSPGYENWDLSVHKNIHFERGVNFQLRAEAFNAFNHTNFVGVGTVFGVSNFGQITSAGPARSMQIGGKLTF